MIDFDSLELVEKILIIIALIIVFLVMVTTIWSVIFPWKKLFMVLKKK